MRDLLLRVARITVVQNALALFGARAFSYLLPLITIPYLARVLGPEHWGTVVFAQSIGLYIVLVIDYSFNISATRSVALHRESKHDLAEILAGVLGAKLALTAGCALVLGVLQLLVPMLRDTGGFLWLALFWGFGFALIPMFYFQGIEQVPRLLMIDLPLRLVSTAGVFLLVRSPDDAWLAIFLQAAGGVTIMVVALATVYREVPFVRPRLAGTVETLREGRDLFSVRISSSIYWMSNPVILGIVAPSQFVGFYAGAERVIKALQTMTEPVSHALFPQSSQLAQSDQTRLSRIVLTTTLIMTGGGLLVAGGLFIAAPLVIRILLGPDYGEAINVFRILIWIIPLMGISMPLIMQWMIPLGMDRNLMWVAIGAGVLHLPIAAYLGFEYRHIGIASAYLATEAGYTLAVAILLHVKGCFPYSVEGLTHVRTGARETR